MLNLENLDNFLEKFDELIKNSTDEVKKGAKDDSMVTESTKSKSPFRIEGDFIYLDAPYIEFYIPMYFFDESGKFGEDLSSTVKVLGIFNVGIFENGKLKELRTLNIPTMITLNVYDSEVREVTLLNGEVVQCKVIKYLKDAKIMSSVVFQDEIYAKDYLKFLMSGKMPHIIPYSKLLDLWRKNQVLNGVHFGLGSVYLELVLSVLCRNPSDFSQKFSKISGKGDAGDYDYKFASVRQICQYNSTFTALTFEDIDSMITTSLNKTRNKVKEQETPVEQIIKF